MAPHETPTDRKWTEIEHLPEWDEEFYDVYTAKKYGKWLMLKTLKEQYRDKEEYRAMIEKEFDVRYNLAHPHIVMINDYEDVPGLGRCIITDDVYGDSLRKLIDTNRVTADTVSKITHQLVDAMEYIQTNHIVHHPIRPENIIFTENIGNLKLINVGFDQKAHLSPAEASEDIFNFGMVLTEALKAVPDGQRYTDLRRVAARCTNPDPKARYRDIQELKLALSNRTNRLFIGMLIFLLVMLGIMAYYIGFQS
ncbi:MAG: protein kinase [Muribaculaceae bacterium]|nr:protein kinase [Muribaculaceae bacterium]MDE7386079.1 protein kinase [Muribaculaceae bacterium]